MTGFGDSFGDAVRIFVNDVDTAVGRARRAAAEARERTASFRRESRNLAESARAGEVRVRPEELTAEELRRAAVGFRTDRGLPVEEFPATEALTEPPAQPEQPGAARRGRGRVEPDDDDDFSQQQIMTKH